MDSLQADFKLITAALLKRSITIASIYLNDAFS